MQCQYHLWDLKKIGGVGYDDVLLNTLFAFNYF